MADYTHTFDQPSQPSRTLSVANDGLDGTDIEGILPLARVKVGAWAKKGVADGFSLNRVTGRCA